MRAIDTNIVVRLCVLDDDVQVGIAKSLLTEPFMILPSVILEAEWVMRSFYKLPPQRIADDLLALLRLPNALAVSAQAVEDALRAAATGADFADALHAHLADEAGASSFATFDQHVRHASGVKISIETLS